MSFLKKKKTEEEKEIASTPKKTKSQKKAVAKKNKIASPLGKKQQINLYEDYLEVLLNSNIIDRYILMDLFEKQKKVEASFISLMDAIIDVHPESEVVILRDLIKERYGLDILIGIENERDLVSLAVSDIFYSKSTSYLGDAEIEKILNSGLLPVSFVGVNKKNYINIITRSPEIPHNILEILDPLMKKKKVFGINKVTICNKEIYDAIYHRLTNFQFSNEI